MSIPREAISITLSIPIMARQSIRQYEASSIELCPESVEGLVTSTGEELICSNPLIAQGAPIVRGSTITVVSVVCMVAESCVSETAKRLILTPHEVRVCVAYARHMWPTFCRVKLDRRSLDF